MSSARWLSCAQARSSDVGGLRGADAGVVEAVLDGGQHEGDVVCRSSWRKSTGVGVADGAQQVVGELVEPAEQGVQRAERRVEVGDLAGGCRCGGWPRASARPRRPGSGRAGPGIRVVGHADFSFVGMDELGRARSRHGTGDRQTMAGGAVAESRSGADMRAGDLRSGGEAPGSPWGWAGSGPRVAGRAARPGWRGRRAGRWWRWRPGARRHAGGRPRRAGSGTARPGSPRPGGWRSSRRSGAARRSRPHLRGMCPTGWPATVLGSRGC